MELVWALVVVALVVTLPWASVSVSFCVWPFPAGPAGAMALSRSLVSGAGRVVSTEENSLGVRAACRRLVTTMWVLPTRATPPAGGQGVVVPDAVQQRGQVHILDVSRQGVHGMFEHVVHDRAVFAQALRREVGPQDGLVGIVDVVRLDIGGQPFAGVGWVHGVGELGALRVTVDAEGKDQRLVVGQTAHELADATGVGCVILWSDDLLQSGKRGEPWVQGVQPRGKNGERRVVPIDFGDVTRLWSASS